MLVLAACTDGASSGSSATPAPEATRDTGYRGDQNKPTWLRFERGARGYLTDSGHPIDREHELYSDVKVCNTPQEWVGEGGCVQRKVGQLVTIRKTGLMGMLSEAEPIQVYTARWRGVVGQTDVLPIIPKGTRIDCSGADGPTGIRIGNDPAEYGYNGPIVLDVTRTARPEAVGLVDVEIVEGEGRGKRGQLAYAQVMDCKIDGFLPFFDNRDVEEP